VRSNWTTKLRSFVFIYTTHKKSLPSSRIGTTWFIMDHASGWALILNLIRPPNICASLHVTDDERATHLIVDVKDSFLDLLVDLLSCVDECLFHICSCLCWSFHKYQTMFTGKCLPFLFLHFSSRFQITTIIKSVYLNWASPITFESWNVGFMSGVSAFQYYNQG